LSPDADKTGGIWRFDKKKAAAVAASNNSGAAEIKA
jgi:hypothetical protein